MSRRHSQRTLASVCADSDDLYPDAMLADRNTSLIADPTCFWDSFLGRLSPARSLAIVNSNRLSSSRSRTVSRILAAGHQSAIKTRRACRRVKMGRVSQVIASIYAASELTVPSELKVSFDDSIFPSPVTYCHGRCRFTKRIDRRTFR